MSKLKIKLIPGLYEELGGEEPASPKWIQHDELKDFGQLYQIRYRGNRYAQKYILVQRNRDLDRIVVVSSDSGKGGGWVIIDPRKMDFMEVSRSRAAAILEGREYEDNRWEGKVEKCSFHDAPEHQPCLWSDYRVIFKLGGKMYMDLSGTSPHPGIDDGGSHGGEKIVLPLPDHTFRLSTDLLELDEDFAKAAGIEGTE